MKEKMERFVLPFSIGCVSQSSVAMGESQPKKEQTESSPTPRKGGGERLSTNGKTKNSVGFPPLPRPNFSAGLQKIIKSIKSLSQLFVVYEEEDEESEMEIGFPTDVQHVAHIGLDGFNNVSNMKSWDRGPEILSLPSLSSRQFELAMATQTHGSLSQGHLQLP